MAAVRGWWCLAVAVAVALLGRGTGAVSTCNREPLGTTSSKTPGSNNYSIKIMSDPQKYIPGEVYTVSLKGLNQEHLYVMQRFTAFLLVVEAAEPTNFYGSQSVGTFRLYDDALTKHSENCPNAIIHTSSVTKSRIQVMWMAPPAGSGCVRFRATVVETRDVWYMDDGELTKELCEDVQESADTQPPVIRDCCACDEAKYEVTFEGLWSRQTHPKDFPTNEWLTHFSDIIGASHSNDYWVWKYGDIATKGLKQVAEWGSTRGLESELKQQSSHIRTIIKARGLWHPNLNGKTFAVFRVDNRNHLMSLVSMLGPTPDWIVGVSALELCLANCTWLGAKTLNLYPWDAGTDSGISYESPSNPTIPREKIRRITTTYPDNDQSPFYDPIGAQMNPLARLTITRQRVYEKSCSDTGPIIYNEDEINTFETSGPEDTREVCRVSEWSEFSPCSVTCGKGRRQRNRSYIMQQKAQMMDCQTQLVANEMCAGEQLFCEGSWPRNGHDGGLTERVCLTSAWTPWTSCTQTCGTGMQTRSRYYLDRMGPKRCDEQTVEKQSCLGEVAECDHTQGEYIQPGCEVTQWSDFSPCSVRCGQGFMTRSRQYLVPIGNHPQCNLKMQEKRQCQGARPDCSVDPEEAGEVCLMPKDPGPCRGNYPRFYFDQDRRICLDFQYGGCRGNRNIFMTYEECSSTCMNSQINRLLPGSVAPTPPRSHHGLESEARVRVRVRTERVNCRVSPWSDWSPCSATCGKAIMERKRRITRQPANGGRRCRKLLRKRKCKRNPRCPRSNDFGGLESQSLHRDPEPTTTTTTTTTTPAPPPPPRYQPHTPSSHLPYDPDQEYIAPALFNPPSILEGRGTGGGGGGERIVFPDYDSGTSADCEMSEWGPWSPCTHSCGPESLQQRSRNVVRAARRGGEECGDRYQRRYCHLPPCNHLRPYH